MRPAALLGHRYLLQPLLVGAMVLTGLSVPAASAAPAAVGSPTVAERETTPPAPAARRRAPAAPAITPSEPAPGQRVTAAGQLTPTDTSALRAVQLQQRVGRAWRRVAAGTTDTTATYSLAFTAPAAGTYSYRAFAPAVVKRVSSKRKRFPAITTEVRTTTVRTVAAPSAPTLTTTPGDGKVDASWTASTPAAGQTLAGYTLYRAGSSTGPWTAVNSAPTTQRSLTVDDLSNGETYWFSVIAVDGAGRQSARSTAVSATPADTTPPPAPSTPTAQAGDGEVSLGWAAVSAADLDGYVVYRASSGSGPWTRLTDNPQQARSYDATGLTNGQTYFFAVSAVDFDGNESARSGAVSAQPAAAKDTTPPPAPGTPSVTAGDTKADLTWPAVSANDLAGYHVYRATSSSGPWTKLTATPQQSRAYAATGLTNGQTYYFAVTSLDTSGNESARSSLTTARPSDTTPPAAPANLVVSPDDQVARLSWDAVQSADLAGYVVYRGTSADGPWTRLTNEPITATAFTATGLTNGSTYWFGVASRDTSGNESGRSTASSVITPTSTYTHCGALTADETWAADRTHRLACDVVVPAGMKLIVAPGAVVKSQSYGISVAGALTSAGTADKPVVFTSLRDDSAGGDTDGQSTPPAAGNWKGISAQAGSSVDLTRVVVRFSYGIQTSNASRVAISNSTLSDTGSNAIDVYDNRTGIDKGTSVITLTNNTITRAAAGGIEVDAVGNPQGSGTQIAVPTVANNTVTNTGTAVGNTRPAVSVFGDALDGTKLRNNTGTGNGHQGISLAGTITNSLDVPLGGLPLLIGRASGYDAQTLTIAKNATMTVAAGQVIKSYRGSLIVNGTLSVAGSAGDPVVFTALTDDTVFGDTNGDAADTEPSAGNWGGISGSDGANLTLANTHVRYSGGIHSYSANKVAVTNSTISDTYGTAIDVYDNRTGIDKGTSVITLTGNTINRATDGGIEVDANGNPQGSGTQIPVPTVSGNTVNNTGARDSSYGNNDHAAIAVTGDALDGTKLRNNTGTGNGHQGISLAGTITNSLDVPLGGLPLLIGYYDNYNTRYLTIAKGATMTVAAGQVIKSYGGGLSINGTLTANGTSTNPVIFTSVHDDTAGGDTNTNGDATKPSAGNWGGISGSDGANLTLANTHVRYSGGIHSYSANKVAVTNSTISDTYGTAIDVYDNRTGIDKGTSVITLTGNTINRATDGGIEVDANGNPQGSGTQIPVPTVSGNTVNNTGARDSSYGNNDHAAIAVTGDALDGTKLRNNTGTGNGHQGISLAGTITNSLDVPLGGLPLLIGYYDNYNTRYLTIAKGATMTVAAGQVIKSYGGGLSINGTLTANGTSTNPVIFTSVHDDTAGGDTNTNGDATKPSAGNWGGISGSDGANLTLANTHVRYSGGIHSYSANKVAVTNSTISDTYGTAIDVYDNRTGIDKGTSVITLTGNTINRATDGGIEVDANGNPQGSGTQIPVPTVSGNTVNNTGARDSSYGNNDHAAIAVTGDALDGTKLRNNTGTGNGHQGISLAGTITNSLDVPLGGLPLLIGYYDNYNTRYLTIAKGATMTVAAGQVIKSYGGGLSINGTLTANGTGTNPVIFTSIHDDTAGGDTNTNGDATKPSAGNWGGISVGEGASAVLTGTTLRYARTALRVQEGGGASIRGRVLNSTMGVDADAFVDATDVDWGDSSGPYPLGTGTPISGIGVMAVPWRGWVAPTQPEAPPRGASPTQDDSAQAGCKDVMFLAVRGSNEPPTDQDGDDAYTDWLSGFGPNIWEVFQGFSDGMKDAKSSRQWKGIGLRYRAMHVPVLENVFGQNPFTSLNMNAYFANVSYQLSIWQGVYRIRQYLEEEFAECGARQKYVLSGYSQGALAIHLYLRSLVSANVRGQIVAVGLLADPAKVGGGAEKLFSDGFTTPPESVKKASGIYRSPMPSAGPIPDDLAARTASMCHNHDIVCAPGLGGVINLAGKHLDYSPEENQALGRWLAQRASG